MAGFYRPANGPADPLWVYSERGVLNYAFLRVLPADRDAVLQHAVNGNGQTLADVLGSVERHRCLTEFELGNNGFGSPDGGLFFQSGEGEWSFVFVEAKVGTWIDSRQEPVLQTVEQLVHLTNAQLDALCRNSSFNSSINGQLELRWRFANAFQAAVANQATLVTEDHAEPAEELMSGDRFYWRLRLQPAHDHVGHWRRVEMGTDLLPLRNRLQDVGDRFHLLAITADKQRPAMEIVRLYHQNQQPLAEAEKAGRLFWLSFHHLTGFLEELHE